MGKRALAIALLLGSAVSCRVERPPSRSYVVDIRGMAFHPALLALAPGDTVVWINHDLVPHSATSEAEPAWTTGTLAQNDTGRYVAGRRGEITYHCTLHPVMEGRLNVQ